MANQPTLMSVPFANGGAKNTIPQNTTTLGKASLVNGFPTETSMPIDDGGIPPQRADFNGMLYWLSTFAMYQQSGGVFTYDSTVDYKQPSIIFYNGDLWWCKQANGPSTVVKTPNASNSAYWILLKDYLANPLSAYPIGSYYISSVATSPATLFGGTWVQVRDRFILAAGSSYSAGTLTNPATGGSATKSLAVANIPSHTHTFTTATGGAHTHTVNGTTQSAGAHTHTVDGTADEAGNHNHSVSGASASNGAHTHTTSGTAASNGNHTHTTSGTAASNGAHTHVVSGDTAETGAHTHGVSGSTAEAGSHSHTRGTMNITGDFSGVGQKYGDLPPTVNGAFYVKNTADEPPQGVYVSNGGEIDDWIGFDASRSGAWTGATSVQSAHKHSISLTSASNGNHKHSISLTSASNGAHTHTTSGTAASAGAHTHTVSGTAASNGAHTHNISLTSGNNGKHTHDLTASALSAGSHTHNINITITSDAGHKHTGTTNATGNGTAFNIMPPYIVAYVWRRTA